MQEYGEVLQKVPTVYNKILNCIGNNSWMSSPGVTFHPEEQNLTNLSLPSFAESHYVKLLIGLRPLLG